jgi:hypothetical protein
MCLKNATIEWDWVGLRPHREPIRVEKDVLSNEKMKKQVIVRLRKSKSSVLIVYNHNINELLKSYYRFFR